MTADPIQFIHSMVEAQLSGKKGRDGRSGPGPVVTLSRDYGSGGKEIAELLAARLSVDHYDKDILDAVAKSAKVDRELMEELDERVRDSRDTWIRALLSGQSMFETSYRRHLVNVFLAITATGGVIVGRGAHAVLVNRKIFRVRIVGTTEICARRLAEWRGISFEEAKKKVEEVDKGRADFVWNMFKSRINDPTKFDLVINTDNLHDWERVVDLIVHAMSAAGFEVPAAKGTAK